MATPLVYAEAVYPLADCISQPCPWPASLAAEIAAYTNSVPVLNMYIASDCVPRLVYVSLLHSSTMLRVSRLDVCTSPCIDDPL